MSTQAFSPITPTAAIAAANSASTPVQVTATAGQGGNNYRIINSGTVMAFLGVGGTSAAATASTVIPTPGTTTAAMPLLPGTDEILTFAQAAWFAAITNSGTTTLYITGGDGM